MSKFSKPMLSLKRFMLRGEVLRLYRDMLRTVGRVPDPADRVQLTQWVRDDFRKHKHHEDELVIKMMLTKGKMTLEEFRATIPQK